MATPDDLRKDAQAKLREAEKLEEQIREADRKKAEALQKKQEAEGEIIKADLDKQHAQEDTHAREADQRRAVAEQKKQQAESEITKADLDKRNAAGPASLFGL